MKIIKLNRKLSGVKESNMRILCEALYEDIIKTKSIIGIEIEIPPMDIKCSVVDFLNTGNKFKKKGGIYFLYDKNRKLVNIGNTSNLNSRIYQKVLGKNGGSKADYYFAKYYDSVALFIEENSLLRNLYEVYLINLLKPSLNYRLNYNNTSIYEETLAKEEKEAKKHSRPGFPSLGYERGY